MCTEISRRGWFAALLAAWFGWMRGNSSGAAAVAAQRPVPVPALGPPGDALTEVTTYVYDSSGDLSQFSALSGGVRTFVYDGTGRLWQA